MSAPLRIYQQLVAQIKHCAPGLRITSVRRVALLVLGIAASEHCSLRRVAREVAAMGLSRAQPESIARRLRRTVADLRLDEGAGYATLLAATITWPQHAPVLLVAGAYWRHLDSVLVRAQALLPPEVRVVVLADRAYDVPPLLDRLAALGWDWIVRVKARSKLVWRGADGSEQPLRTLVSAALSGPGTRLRASGQSFKKAGWRAVQVVGEWAHGYAEPLVVLTSLPARWSVLSRYARRCWIEAAFRQDKSAGWDWHHSQIRDPQHQQRLLVGLAWASLLVLSLGAQEAATALAARRAQAGERTATSHPRDSLFTLGLHRFRAGLYGTKRGRLRWRAPCLTAPSWCAVWRTVAQPPPHPQPVLP